MSDERVISIDTWRAQRAERQRTTLQRIADECRRDAVRIRVELAERRPSGSAS